MYIVLKDLKRIIRFVEIFQYFIFFIDILHTLSAYLLIQNHRPPDKKRYSVYNFANNGYAAWEFTTTTLNILVVVFMFKNFTLKNLFSLWCLHNWFFKFCLILFQWFCFVLLVSFRLDFWFCFVWFAFVSNGFDSFYIRFALCRCLFSLDFSNLYCFYIFLSTGLPYCYGKHSKFRLTSAHY